MQTLAAYTESFCIITPGGFLYRRVLYKYMLGMCERNLMSLTEFIESNYSTACEMQRGIEKDNRMKNMLLRRNIDKELVKSWMRDYGLFQGIKAENRDAVVEKYAAVIFKITDYKNTLDRENIRIMFNALFSSLFNAVPRKWLSATSKLLWCSFPDQIVIYDAFVERALVVLQCIKPYLARFPRIGISPDLKSEANIDNVVDFYMNYQDMVKAIFSEHKAQLIQLRNKYSEEYPHDIRIIDKLLWMVGSPNQSFSLDNVSCNA